MEQNNSINIIIDNRKAAYEATSHLIEQGCKNIVHITAPPKQNVYKDRLQGYKQALNDNLIQFKDENVIIGNLSLEAGSDAAELIKQMNPLPDAVFVANDNCAVGCILNLKQSGIRIPEEIAFVGFNNDPVSRVIEPNLSTINYPGYEMGEVAARILINHLTAEAPLNTTNTIILRSEFILRESSLKNKSNYPL